MPRRLIRRERSIEAACCRYAVGKGCIVLKLSPPPRGVPDRVFLLPGGKGVLVEFKRPGGRLSPAQKEMHLSMKLIGCNVQVFDDVEAFKSWLDGYLG